MIPLLHAILHPATATIL